MERGLTRHGTRRFASVQVMKRQLWEAPYQSLGEAITRANAEMVSPWLAMLTGRGKIKPLLANALAYLRLSSTAAGRGQKFGRDVCSVGRRATAPAKEGLPDVGSKYGDNTRAGQGGKRDEMIVHLRVIESLHRRLDHAID